jgi:Fur family transcriptional regulator, zinc uptake regulator
MPAAFGRQTLFEAVGVKGVKKQRPGPAFSQPVGDADEFVRSVQRVCREQELRMTPLRADVIRILASSPRPLKAYDLLHEIRASKARSAPATAYRTLNFLLGLGLIHRIESLNAFVVCSHPGHGLHVASFLVCNNCQQSTELEDNNVGVLLTRLAHSASFEVVNSTIEVRGLCARCSAG